MPINTGYLTSAGPPCVCEPIKPINRPANLTYAHRKGDINKRVQVGIERK